jgi:hypothetical protein
LEDTEKAFTLRKIICENELYKWPGIGYLFRDGIQGGISGY